ncbi:surf-like protein [Saitozyma podzolica]|uniref:SURF1-like protein n=1 Tax=Saitozyma podzolica TaxID=1890683 RepID=A0A427YXB6_9TREE|nr:surf-like protein [Saitozyma podzolica]
MSAFRPSFLLLRPTLSRPLAPRLPRLPRSTPPTTSHSPSHFRPSWSSRPASTLSTPSRRSLLLRPTTIVLMFVPILTGFLGIWQIRRLQWKVALIDEVDRNLAREPMALPNRINLDALPDFSFRRVLVRGHFTSPPLLVGPQVVDGVPGYNLILPLELAPGLESASVNGDGNGNGDVLGEEVVVEGMLLRPGERSVWTPENNKEGNEWFWRDVKGMAEWVGGEEKNVQPVLIDAIDDGRAPASLLMQQGTPLGREPHVELRNQHASYAATWLSLCAATSAMLVYVLRKGKPAGGPRVRRA